jgi:hypothetical protein
VCVHHDPGSRMAKLDEYFKMKEGSIQVPTFYLGAKLKNTFLPNGVVAWGMSSSKYVQSAVHNVNEYMAALPGDQLLVKKASGPFAGGYKPELDEIPEVDPIGANLYQSQIGILRWCVELGRIEIITEVSMLSTHLCLPREGHLEAFFRVFAYLVLHHNARVLFDTTHPAVDMGTFIKTDWKSMYGDVKEMIPSDAPVYRGKEVDLRLFVDSDHAGEKFTRRSRTGSFIYLNMAPIVWFSKSQPTMESSVFGAEFVASMIQYHNFLRVSRMSEVASGCGSRILPRMYNGDEPESDATNQWPIQPRPTKGAWKIWKKYLGFMVTSQTMLALRQPLGKCKEE